MLKAKCPVLVEHMIHSSMNMAGGEAFALLLKRPWNPAVGLYSTDKQVKQLWDYTIGKAHDQVLGGGSIDCYMVIIETLYLLGDFPFIIGGGAYR